MRKRPRNIATICGTLICIAAAAVSLITGQPIEQHEVVILLAFGTIILVVGLT